MFDDPQKELKHLQDQLLAAEDDGAWLDRELAEAHRLLGDLPAEKPVPQAAPVRNFTNNFGAEDYEDENEEDEALDNELSQKRSIRNLTVVALIELAGILGLLGYWALKLL